jgi:phosphoribosylformimino-5-aminoimidazole carboxamide ribotide isomerase
MILLPAVDILGAKAVRLARGDFEARTEYDADPREAARRWVAEGARALHVVDLDGARSGTPQNLGHVERIARDVPIPVQVGGGLRTADSVRQAIEAGAARVVLGTAAYTDIDFIDTALADYGDRVIVSVDVRAGKLAASGWTEQTEIPAESVIQELGSRGVHRFVYSNIDRDGMLEGPDLSEVQRVARTVRGSFIYSGGVSTLDDLHALVALRQVNLAGVIVGKALYERRFEVADAQAILDGDRQDGKRS